MVFVHASGVQATVAGVALAFIIPTHLRINAQEFFTQARSLPDKFDRTETGNFLVLTSKGQQEALLALERASASATARFSDSSALHNFAALIAVKAGMLHHCRIEIP